MKLNCWEIKECGRQPRGANVDVCGICPAATDTKYDGINNGKNGGRFCWTIAGTHCEEEIQGTYANKLGNCLNCEVLKTINIEESRLFILTLSDAQKEVQNNRNL